MSLDRSLRTQGSLVRHRNVLTRTERLARMADEGRWQDGDGVFGLPKISNRKAKVGGKAKKKGTAETEAAADETQAAPPAEEKKE